MFSKIFLNKENLLNNLNYIKSKKDSKICAMVKANAYGHGAKEIVKILSDYVDYFGVSNENEAFEIREFAKNGILVFGYCENYINCMKKGISFAVFSLEQIKKIVKLAKEHKMIPKMHLCVNSGMNRYGVKSLKEFVRIIRYIEKNNMQLEGVYTHFSSLTSDEDYTIRQKEIFDDFIAFIPENWNSIIHIGGGNTIYRDFSADMFRIGLELYGYGNENLKPVLEIESKIVDLQKVDKGEHVGYLCGFTAVKKMLVATIPLGYGDGLSRKLSGKLQVKIKGEKTLNVGNICMDAFMVDVTNIKCKKGDSVVIPINATKLAEYMGTTEYEVLTNFGEFRGERIIN